MTVVIIVSGVFFSGCREKKNMVEANEYSEKTEIVVNHKIMYYTLEEIKEAPEDITWLRISYMKLNNTEWLEELINLEELYIGDSKIKDLSFIAKYSKIHNLNLLYDGISDISPLASLSDTDIDRIDVAYNNIVDISPLKDITSLTSLSVMGNNVIDISSVSNLENLEIFVLSDGNPEERFKDKYWMHDLSPIYSLKNLKLIQLILLHDCDYDFKEEHEKFGEVLDVH